MEFLVLQGRGGNEEILPRNGVSFLLMKKDGQQVSIT
jgi:hypothetical protein